MQVDTEFAFQRYQAVRMRLPDAVFSRQPDHADGLLQIAARFDVFLFDAFGVLNVGNAVIPGAPECVRKLQGLGKQTLVVTNAGSVDKAELMNKYHALGYHFTRSQVISSRGRMIAALGEWPAVMHWGVAAFHGAGVERLGIRAILLEDDASVYDQVDGMILLSSQDWNNSRQAMLVKTLRANPRPVLVGNPDIVAPRESGFSLEPGYYAHDLADKSGIEPQFYGKPFHHVFAEASRRTGVIDPSRVLMLGDTLHTDILGGAAAGIRTALVTGHGLFRGQDTGGYIRASGIVPNVIMPSI